MTKVLFLLLSAQLHGAQVNHAARGVLTATAVAIQAFTHAFRQSVGHRAPSCYQEYLTDLISFSAVDTKGGKRVPPVLSKSDRMCLAPLVREVQRNADAVRNIGFKQLTRTCIPGTFDNAEDLLHEVRLICWVMKQHGASNLFLSDLVREQENLLAIFRNRYHRLGAHDYEADLLVASREVDNPALLALCNQSLPAIEENQERMVMGNNIQDDLHSLQVALGCGRSYRAIRTLKEKAEGVEIESNWFMSTYVPDPD